jgi:hypothetical protein
MIWLIFAMLWIVGLAALFTSYGMVGGLIQLSVIVTLVALGIHRIRRYRVD